MKKRVAQHRKCSISTAAITAQQDLNRQIHRNDQITNTFNDLQKRQHRQTLSLDVANSRRRPPKSMKFVYFRTIFCEKFVPENGLPVLYFSLFAESLETLGRKRGQDFFTSLRAKNLTDPKSTGGIRNTEALIIIKATGPSPIIIRDRYQSGFEIHLFINKSFYVPACLDSNPVT